jgi:hypothetical protein
MMKMMRIRNIMIRTRITMTKIDDRGMSRTVLACGTSSLAGSMRGLLAGAKKLD